MGGSLSRVINLWLIVYWGFSDTRDDCGGDSTRLDARDTRQTAPVLIVCSYLSLDLTQDDQTSSSGCGKQVLIYKNLCYEFFFSPFGEDIHTRDYIRT
jgi:hypothetical protein